MEPGGEMHLNLDYVIKALACRGHSRRGLFALMFREQSPFAAIRVIRVTSYIHHPFCRFQRLSFTLHGSKHTFLRHHELGN